MKIIRQSFYIIIFFALFFLLNAEKVLAYQEIKAKKVCPSGYALTPRWETVGNKYKFDIKYACCPSTFTFQANTCYSQSNGPLKALKQPATVAVKTTTDKDKVTARIEEMVTGKRYCYYKVNAYELYNSAGYSEGQTNCSSFKLPYKSDYEWLAAYKDGARVEPVIIDSYVFDERCPAGSCVFYRWDPTIQEITKMCVPVYGKTDVAIACLLDPPGECVMPTYDFLVDNTNIELLNKANKGSININVNMLLNDPDYSRALKVLDHRANNGVSYCSCTSKAVYPWEPPDGDWHWLGWSSKKTYCKSGNPPFDVDDSGNNSNRPVHGKQTTCKSLCCPVTVTDSSGNEICCIDSDSSGQNCGPSGRYDTNNTYQTEYNSCMSCVCTNNSPNGNVWSEIGCINTSDLGLIATVSRIFLGVVGGIVILRFIQAGMMSSAEDPEKKKEAIKIATGAVIGLIFGFVLPVVLNFVFGDNILKIQELFSLR